MRNKKKQTEQLRGKGAAEKETGGTELLLKAISRATIKPGSISSCSLEQSGVGLGANLMSSRESYHQTFLPKDVGVNNWLYSKYQ